MTSTPIRLFSPEIALDLWYEALATENGIAIAIPDTSDTMQIMNQLYAAKSDIGDARLACLSIHVPANAEEIFIYKKTVELTDD
jgi:hypothetical protein